MLHDPIRPVEYRVNMWLNTALLVLVLVATSISAMCSISLRVDAWNARRDLQRNRGGMPSIFSQADPGDDRDRLAVGDR